MGIRRGKGRDRKFERGEIVNERTYLNSNRLENVLEQIMHVYSFWVLGGELDVDRSLEGVVELELD